MVERATAEFLSQIGPMPFGVYEAPTTVGSPREKPKPSHRGELTVSGRVGGNDTETFPKSDRTRALTLTLTLTLTKA